MNETNLNKYYQINVNHLLSTRLDSDISKEFFDKVVFHGTAYNSLLTIADSFISTNQSTFTLTGSYGTGKSTLGAILTGLISNNILVRESVRKLISEKKLLKKLDKVFSYSDERPWLIIKAVGGVSSPLELFYRAIIQALKNANLIDVFENDLFFLEFEEITNEYHLIEWIDTIFRKLEGKISGTLFVLDEMGKLLENIARKSGDLHLFQELSEKINRLSTKECPFIFIGILHQSFSDYAKGLSHQISLEWSKIQGRYIDVAYRISLDESIALVSKTIKRTNKKLPEQIESLNECLIENIKESINSRLTDNNPKIKQYFKDALPLHPLTTVLLGAISKSSFSQNERSIFSFLLSVEPYSFRRFLETDVLYNETYTIVDLWDYLSQNLQHQILSSKEGHAWGVVEQAITLLSQKLNSVEENDSSFTDIYFKLIKAIAMMNIFGKTLGVYPTRNLLLFSLPFIDSSQKKLVSVCLENLVKWGLITYWNRTNSYEVVETSELNIQQLLNEKLLTLSQHQNYLDYIEYNSNTVLAKRYYQQKGIMRWMEQHLIINSTDLKKLDSKFNILKNKAFSYFVLIAEQSLTKQKLEKLSKEYPNFAIAKLNNLNEISIWAKEIFALKQLNIELPKINVDQAAKREYEQRLNFAYQQLDILFQESFENSDWFYAGVAVEKKSLSMMVSDFADNKFSACPSVFNELVVRNDVSSSAAFGRRKLMEIMLEHRAEENLGIEKFPPEKAIYLSCLKELGLHRLNQETGEWFFSFPNVGDEELTVNHKKIAYLFEEGFNLLKSRKEIIKISELYDLWSKPPFGLPQGILPIWGLALLLAKQDALAFYDQDISQDFRFISEMDEEFINKLIKHPAEVGVTFIRDQLEKNKFIDILTAVINDIHNKNIEANPLQIARYIVSYVVKQPNWVKFSKNINYFSRNTQKLRGFIVKADDPYKLLFDDMYELFDINILDEVKFKSNIADFFLQIDSAKNSLLQDFLTKLEEELGEFDNELMQYAKIISQSAADWQMQKFAYHIANSSEHSNQWIINLITLLSQVPERDWTDDSIKKAFEMISNYVYRFKQLCFFVKNGHPDLIDTKDQKHLAIIVNTDNGLEEYNRDIRISSKIQEKIVIAANSFRAFIENQDDLNKDAKALVLYELLKDYLSPVSEENNKHVD
ncbi:hypothetical protein V8P87_00220 [Acinetobacter baumannii]